MGMTDFMLRALIILKAELIKSTSACTRMISKMPTAEVAHPGIASSVKALIKITHKIPATKIALIIRVAIISRIMTMSL